jgi:hypothetical protein|tara:strand:+ start:4193 stop:4351 length:159 start_codon:yes stop_codon:yes gene_type:complete
MYSIVQKEQQGFDKAVEECKFRMSTLRPLSLNPRTLVVTNTRHVCCSQAATA